MANTHTSAPLLSCTALVKQYDDGSDPITVLNGVSFSVNQGEQIAVIGASGSGKSSLLHILGALDKPNSGKVQIDGVDIFSLNATAQAQLRNKKLGFVYQFHHLLAEFSALENVAMPLLIAGEKPTTAKQIALNALDQVGLANRASHIPSALSGGERQRTAIARAIVNRPEIVLADEPTGNLDARTGEQIYELMLSLQAQMKMAFVVVTHDMSLAEKMDKVFALKNGLLQAVEPA